MLAGGVLLASLEKRFDFFTAGAYMMKCVHFRDKEGLSDRFVPGQRRSAGLERRLRRHSMKTFRLATPILSSLLVAASTAESQACEWSNECLVRTYARVTEYCVTDTCSGQVEVWRLQGHTWTCQIMQIGCPYPVQCCGFTEYDYPPVPCDTSCAGCQPMKLPSLRTASHTQGRAANRARLRARLTLHDSGARRVP